MAGYFTELRKHALQTLETIDHIISSAELSEDETIVESQDEMAIQAKEWLSKLQEEASTTLHKITSEKIMAMSALDNKLTKTLSDVENAKKTALLNIAQSKPNHKKGYSSDQPSEK